MAKNIKGDQYLYFKSLGCQALAHIIKGNVKTTIKFGKKLTAYGHEYSNTRSLCMGYGFIGDGYEMEGNLSEAIHYREKALKAAADPYYAEFARAFLGMAYVLDGQLDKAQEAFEQGIKYSQEFGVEVVGTLSQIFMGLIHISKGRMSYGLYTIEKSQELCLKNKNLFFYYVSEYVLGKIYCEIAQSSGNMQISSMLKNLGFLIKNVPSASRKAEYHFNKAIETAREIEATGYLGLTYLDLGLFHKDKKRKKRASRCISEAIKLFEQCGAVGYSQKANEALNSLN